MLIKYKTSVINLDKVSEFIQSGTKTIRFYFDSYDHESNQTTCSELEFDTEEERDDKFEKITCDYENECRVCDLDY